jgi:membrane protease YdiL (CAAX protease family)
MKIKNWIRSQPVASYFLMVFLIAWGGSILGLGAKFLQDDLMSLKDVVPAAIAMLGAPCLVGIAWTYICDGREGMRDLFARMKKWKVPARWYAVALIFPLLILVVLIPLSILVTPDLSPIFFSIGIPIGLLAGFLEEIGWMGFVYPKMRLRLSVLRASIYLGLIHALWHAAADFLGNFNSFGMNWFLYFAAFFVFVVALRVIIAWVYENTGSLLLTQLIHASSSGFLTVLVAREYAGETWYIFYAIYAVVIWLVAGLIIIRNEKQLVKQPA